MPDSIEKVPIPGDKTGVNQPASPYGDVAQLDELKSKLGPPGAGGPGGPGGPPAPPPDEPRRNVPPPGDLQGAPQDSPFPGLPASIGAQSDRPGVDPSTPMTPGAPGPGAAVDATQRRMQVIIALQQSDNEAVVEWADMVLELLIGGEDR